MLDAPQGVYPGRLLAVTDARMVFTPLASPAVIVLLLLPSVRAYFRGSRSSAVPAVPAGTGEALSPRPFEAREGHRPPATSWPAPHAEERARSARKSGEVTAGVSARRRR
ncbi:hypothetical protein [Nonomuraea sp. NPDC050691]|uniref:hypothetical protein n=1 Tax=Nonomuraea sp. NPDC050691 TaxID=3155661 RepID=UPI0033D93FF9